MLHRHARITLACLLFVSGCALRDEVSSRPGAPALSTPTGVRGGSAGFGSAGGSENGGVVSAGGGGASAGGAGTRDGGRSSAGGSESAGGVGGAVWPPLGHCYSDVEDSPCIAYCQAEWCTERDEVHCSCECDGRQGIRERCPDELQAVADCGGDEKLKFSCKDLTFAGCEAESSALNACRGLALSPDGGTGGPSGVGGSASATDAGFGDAGDCTPTATCAAYCDAYVGANCSQESMTLERCHCTCDATLSAVGCSLVADALVGCSGFGVACSDFGYPELVGCDDELAAYTACLAP